MSAASPAASSSTSSAGSPASSSSHTQLAGSKRKASGKPIDPERAARLEARQARNRASAQISRDRKKAALEGLESELDSLRRDNAALQARAAEAQRLETRVAALENLVRCLLQAGAPPLGSASPLGGLADSLLTPHAIVDPAATLSSLSPSSPAARPLVSEPTASSSLLAHPTSSPATLSTHPTHSLFAAQSAAPAASLPPAESHDSASPSVRLPAAEASRLRAACVVDSTHAPPRRALQRTLGWKLRQRPMAAAWRACEAAAVHKVRRQQAPARRWTIRIRVRPRSGAAPRRKEM
jgi:hypothetical protein